MFWGRREEKLRRKRRKILAEGNYIFCRGEEKRRRKRRKISGDGKYILCQGEYFSIFIIVIALSSFSETA